jgi:hypothetical protein
MALLSLFTMEPLIRQVIGLALALSTVLMMNNFKSNNFNFMALIFRLTPIG